MPSFRVTSLPHPSLRLPRSATKVSIIFTALVVSANVGSNVSQASLITIARSRSCSLTHFGGLRRWPQLTVRNPLSVDTVHRTLHLEESIGLFFEERKSHQSCECERHRQSSLSTSYIQASVHKARNTRVLRISALAVIKGQQFLATK
jgi:hypothetical protein